MDTLGTISPRPAEITETAPRLETFERLRYLGESGKIGILTGLAGTGKTELFHQLAKRLRRDGISVAQINVNGLGGPELAHQFAVRLGLGLPFQAPEFETWARLQEYAESRQALEQPLTFLIDHLDRAKESIATPLMRLMGLFDSAGWLLSTRIPVSERWNLFFRDQGGLRVELKELQPRESAQILSRQLARQAPQIQVTPDGLEAFYELSGGKIRQLKQLAELTTLAADAEGFEEIDAALVRTLMQELAGTATT